MKIKNTNLPKSNHYDNLISKIGCVRNLWFAMMKNEMEWKKVM